LEFIDFLEFNQKLIVFNLNLCMGMSKFFSFFFWKRKNIHNFNISPEVVSEESEYDVVTISGVLKNYFRQLPKSIFPPKLYQDFVSIPSTFLYFYFWFENNLFIYFKFIHNRARIGLNKFNCWRVENEK